MGKAKTKQRFKRTLIALVVTALVTVLILIDRWILNSGRESAPGSVTPTPTSTTAADSLPLPTSTAFPTLPLNSPSPLPTGSVAAGASPSVSASLPALKLIVPVAGVRAEQLRDTYTEARSEGRVHNAIDIIAPRGTPVLAATEGKVVKLFNSVRGGITVYQLANDQKTVLYYAHLDRYADGLTEGKLLQQGETIGYVGDTGNSGVGNYHLHFAVWLVTDPKRYWDGENINPYLLLRP